MTRPFRCGLAALFVLGIIAVGVGLDRLSKAWAMDALSDGERIAILPGIGLRLVFNPGAAFGLGAESGRLLGVGVSILVLAGAGWIGWRIVQRRPLMLTLLLAVVLAGGIGNLLDRVFRADSGPFTGSVVDFIAVDWFSIFNVADIFTVSGMAALLVYILIKEMRDARRRIDTPPPASDQAT